MDKFEKFKKVYSGLSDEYIQQKNEEDIQRSEQQYKKFKSDFQTGICCYCGLSLDAFNKDKPCHHWLLHPKGFKKKHLPALFDKYNYHQIDAYLRWVANFDTPMRNINDLKSEQSGTKIIEQTIRYKNIEWAFSSSKGDIKGHKDKSNSDFPHYHFQMMVNGKPVVSFSDYHIPFHEYDLFTFAMNNDPDINANYRVLFGEGMDFAMENENAMEFIKQSQGTDDGSNSLYRIQSFISAKPGTTFSGDQIVELMKEAKEKNVTLSSMLHKIENTDVEVSVIPGDGVVEQSHRTQRRKRKKHGH